MNPKWWIIQIKERKRSEEKPKDSSDCISNETQSALKLGYKLK